MSVYKIRLTKVQLTQEIRRLFLEYIKKTLSNKTLWVEADNCDRIRLVQNLKLEVETSYGTFYDMKELSRMELEVFIHLFRNHLL